MGWIAIAGTCLPCRVKKGSWPVGNDTLSGSFANKAALAVLSALRPVNASSGGPGKIVLTAPKGKITDPAYVSV